jgi:hypothetical protein
MDSIPWAGYVFSKENIVHAAAAFYLAGFLFRDQMLLRGLIILGDIVYVLYFFYAPDTPLWGGIFWSGLFIVVNLVMLAIIVADRRNFGLAPHETVLFEQLGTFTPGQFRKLRSVARFETAGSDMELVKEGEALSALFYVIEGEIRVEKSGGYRARDARAFVGEVAYLLERPASATVRVAAGARYFSFDSQRLRALSQRSADFGMALQSAMNRNMANKIALAGVDHFAGALT